MSMFRSFSTAVQASFDTVTTTAEALQMGIDIGTQYVANQHTARTRNTRQARGAWGRLPSQRARCAAAGEDRDPGAARGGAQGHHEQAERLAPSVWVAW